MKKIVLSVSLIMLLAGCTGQLPEDKKHYVGLWKSNEVSLLITEDGGLEYEKKGAVTTSISAPIKEFTDEKITAGVWFLTAEFVIGRPAREEEGIWSVVIDGDELYKADQFGRLPQATRVPSLGELRELVAGDLRRLNVGLKTNDFSEFVEHSSMLFQSQFNNEKLQELYKPFVERGVDLEEFMVGEFVLTKEPSVSPEGVLTIVGRYPTEPVALKFDSSYVYSYPKWTSIGVELAIGRD